MVPASFPEAGPLSFTYEGDAPSAPFTEHQEAESGWGPERGKMDGRENLVAVPDKYLWKRKGRQKWDGSCRWA